MKISHSAPLLVIVVVFIEAVFVFGMKTLLDRSENDLLRAEKSARIVRESQNIIIGLNEMNQAVRDSAWFKSNKSNENMIRLQAKLIKSLEILGLEASNSKESLVALSNLKQDVNEIVAHCSAYYQRFTHNDRENLVEALQAEVDTFQSIMTRVLSHNDELLKEQKSLLTLQSSSQIEQRKKLKDFLMVALIINTAIISFLTSLFVIFLTRKINRLLENATRLKEGEKLNQKLGGNDEIAILDQIFHDMSESLATSQRMEAAYFENAVDVLGSINQKGYFTRVSPSCFTVWGYTQNVLMSKLFVALTIEKDQQQVVDFLLKSQQDGLPCSFETQVRRANGQIMQSFWTIKWSTEERSFFFSAHDNTLQKEKDILLKSSAERTLQIIQAMPVGLFLASKDGHFNFTNAALEELLQYGGSELGGEAITKVFALPGVQSGQQIQLSHYEGNVSEITATDKNGWTKYIEFSVRSISFEDSTCYLGLVVDTTQRHELQVMRQQFFTMITHELRSPLASIRSHIEMSLMGINGQLNGTGERGAKNSLTTIDRLLKLIADIIDSEKMSEGAFKIQLDSVSASSVVYSAANEVRSLASNRGISLILNLIDISIRADHDRVVQILVNLMSNAIKFSPQNSSLTISTMKSDSSVRFEIIDQGRGIPEAKLDQVFDKYTQVKNTDSHQGAGSGLGLAIAKELVAAQGGRIGVSSELGVGSTFWFELPIIHA